MTRSTVIMLALAAISSTAQSMLTPRTPPATATSILTIDASSQLQSLFRRAKISEAAQQRFFDNEMGIKELRRLMKRIAFAFAVQTATPSTQTGDFSVDCDTEQP